MQCFASRRNLSWRLSPLNTPLSIPTYLLPCNNTSQVTLRRYSSNVHKKAFIPAPYRIKTSQPTHRRINSPSLTPEQIQCLNTAKALGLELTTAFTSHNPTLSHLTSSGTAHMISITSKPPSHRTATAVCKVLFSSPSAHTAFSSATLQKGDALAVARVAGIMAAKRT